MNYSRRQLEALGEPLGESVTHVKAGGFGRIYGGGGGGGGSSPVQQQTSIQELPEWARGAAQETLAKGQALTSQPYQTYSNDRIAGFSPLQQQAQQNAANMTTAPQLSQATGMATQAGLQGLGAAYNPGYFGNQYRSPGQYNPGQFSMLQAQAPDLQQFQMGPAQQVGTQDYTGANVEQYMSPYMQNVVDVQQREAKRQSDILGTQQAGQAVQSGAFGGSRAGLLEAERQRNLATQLGNIQATGSQAAFQNAQQQFNQQQQANLQAALANQQAGLTVGGQNLGAQLGIQQLGAGQNLQAQLANQQALQNAQQAAEQSRQYGYGQSMASAANRAQYGLAGQQLGEQSRQYGAGLGLQGAGIGLQAAGALGNLGQTQYQQNVGINQLQNQYGAQQQALQQQGLSQAYQDFLNQQNYPYRQLGFMSDLIRGLPLGQQSTSQVYQPTTALQTAGALGLGAYGLKQLGMFADGGEVKGYAGGGSVDSPDNVASIVHTLSDEQLAQAEKAAQARGDFEQLQAIQVEKGMRASERGGIAGAFNSLPYQTRAQMASGGIIAFSGDEDGNDQQTGQMVSTGAPGFYGSAIEQGMGYNKRLGEFKEETLSDEDIDNAIKRRYALEQRLAGESPYAAFTKHLEESEAGRGEAMKQAKGFAALQAMGAITQPGGLIRGLGAAGSAFGGAMEKANQADRAEKRSLASMKFNLADAERKERMGMTRSAVSAAAEAIKDKRDAERSRLKVLETQANVAAKLAQAAKPVGSAGAGPKPLKLAEQLAAAEVEHEENPTEASLKRVAGLRRAMAQSKTSDVGGTKADLANAQLQSNEDKAVLAARQKAEFSTEYVAAKTKAEKKAVLDAAEASARSVFKRQNRAPAASGAPINLDD